MEMKTIDSMVIVVCGTELGLFWLDLTKAQRPVEGVSIWSDLFGSLATAENE
jgi:hypothetical protein